MTGTRTERVTELYTGLVNSVGNWVVMTRAVVCEPPAEEGHWRKDQIHVLSSSLSRKRKDVQLWRGHLVTWFHTGEASSGGSRLWLMEGILPVVRGTGRG